MSVKLAYLCRSATVLLHNSARIGRSYLSKTEVIDMHISKSVVFAAALVTALPALAGAKPPLREVREIDDQIFYGAVANEIDKYCDSISGRRMKAISDLWSLRSKANKLGYSDAEIRDYVESDAEKDRMRAKGKAYLAANGVSYDKPETFCTLGHAEISRNSAIGVYLKAK